MRSPSPRRTPATGVTRLTVAAIALALSATGVGCDAEPTDDASTRPIGSTTGDGDVTSDGTGAENNGGSAGDQTRSTAIRDTRSDRSTTGRAPAFVEIDGAGIEGDTDTLALSMTLAGKIPALMPDEVTTMRVTFVIVAPGDDRYEFFAHATRNGWTPFASGREDAEPPFTEDLDISGRTIVMNVDRSYLGPPGPFKWTANVAWTRRAERGEAYAFDFVPKKGYADFP